jgi:filamentous hemagglutinin family protein
MGDSIGSSLFHSFSRFDVGRAEVATFDSRGIPAGQKPTNVIARVTGGLRSTIEGRIRSTIDGADLYLINPHGFTLTGTSSLDVPGSFHLSTADELRFEKGVLPAAATPIDAKALLASDPREFGFLSPLPASVELRGGSSDELPQPLNDVPRLGGLAVREEGSLDVNAGPVTLRDNAFLAATSGSVRVVSLSSPGWVNVEGTGPLAVSADATLGSVDVERSRISVRPLPAEGANADPGPAIWIRAGELTVSDAGAVSSLSSSPHPRRIEIDASRRFDLAAGSVVSTMVANQPGADVLIRAPVSEVNGSITTTGQPGSTGRSGNVSFVAADTLKTSGATISTGSTSTEGGAASSAGAIRAEVGSLEIVGSRWSASTASEGEAGEISILAAGNVHIGKQSRISNGTVASGEGGSLSINSGGGVLIDGGSLIENGTRGTGSGGPISVAAKGAIKLEGLGEIANNSRGAGDAGSIAIRGGSLVLDNGRITAQTLQPSPGGGDGGTITIEAGDVEIVHDGFAATGTAGDGHAGDLSVSATSVRIADRRSITTGLSVGSDPGSSGTAGSITISSQGLAVENGGFVGASTLGSGHGGSVDIRADDVLIAGNGLVSSSTRAAGDAGDVSVTAGEVELTSGGTIRAISEGTGKSGNVWISTPKLTITSGAAVSAATSGSGRGGDITLRVSALDIATGGTISTRSVGNGAGLAGELPPGRGGSISILGASKVKLSDATISGTTEEADGGDILIEAKKYVDLKRSSISTSVAGGEGSGGNIFIDPDFVILREGSITATARKGQGGNIRIVIDRGAMMMGEGSRILASSEQGIDGRVEIDAPDSDITGSLAGLPETFLDATALMRERCGTRELGRAQESAAPSSFVVRERKGLAGRPDELLMVGMAQHLKEQRGGIAKSSNAEHSAHFIAASDTNEDAEWIGSWGGCGTGRNEAHKAEP